MNSILTEDMTVKDIVVRFQQTREALETLGIDYCCGGKIPLYEAAQHAGLSVHRVLTDLTQALEGTNQEAAAVGDWNSVSLTELVDHIEHTHHVFMKEQLPRLSGLLNKTIQAHGIKHGKMLERLKYDHSALRTDIEMHLEKEEQILFPLIRQMEAFQHGRGPALEMHCGSIANPIHQMEYEHDVAGRFLAQMRHISDDYTLPDEACPTFTALFEGLAALEKDLHEHIHLENNILFPKAEDLERLSR